MRGRGADKLLVETKRSCRLCVRAAAWAREGTNVTLPLTPLLFHHQKLVFANLCKIYTSERHDDRRTIMI